MKHDRSFSELLRQIETGASAPPELIDQLEAALRFIMSRTGMWHLPPAYLGYSDWSRWEARDAGMKPAALRDLALDAYLEAIVRVFPPLMVELRRTGNIDNLVMANLRRFLIDRQRRTDPRGWAVFKNAQAAAMLCVRAGSWLTEHLDDRSGMLRSHARLFRPGNARTPPCALDDLRDRLAAAPAYQEIVRSIGGRSLKVRETLAAILRDLPLEQPAAFLLVDLVKILKNEAPSAGLQTRLSLDHDPRAPAVDEEPGRESTFSPEEWTTLSESFEAAARRFGADRAEWRNFYRLARQARRSILAAGYRESVETTLLAILEWMVEAVENGDEPPRPAEIAARLGQPRSTVSGHLRRLEATLAELRSNESRGNRTLEGKNMHGGQGERDP